jgi:hypothetical protein
MKKNVVSRILALGLTAVMTVGLAACGGGSSAQSTAAQSTAAAGTASVSEVSEASSAAASRVRQVCRIRSGEYFI